MGERIFIPFPDKGEAHEIGGADYGLEILRGGVSTRGTHGRSQTFVARWEGWCPRCKRSIKIGDEIRFHNDYDKAVHSGCADYSEATPRSYVVHGRRKPPMCPKCFCEHNGDCA